MVNAGTNLFTGAVDFRLQCRDTVMKFVDRERVEILKRQAFQGIVGPLGQIVIHVHSGNVDAIAVAVNMARDEPEASPCSG